jgi:putative oxidoreductase
MRTASASLALLLLRLVLATVFVAHGLQKLVTQGVAGTADGFAGMGVPFPGIAAPLVIGLEIGGGVLLAVGLLARPIAVLLAADMAVAWALVHASSGFFAQDGGFEYVLVLAAASLTIALAGAGRFSVDGVVAPRLGSRRRREAFARA